MRRTVHDVVFLTMAVVALAIVCRLFMPCAHAQGVDARGADQLFNTPAGNHVRIVGGVVPEGAPVLPSPIGDAVSVPGVPASALCNVVLDALPVENKDSPYGVVPGIPELAHAFGKASWPVPVAGSEGTVGNVYWNALFKGGDCVTAADSSAYVVSSMAELRPFVGAMAEWKCRLLRAQVQETRQVEGQPATVKVMVSACDPRVDRAKDEVTVPHGWAGRWGDLNFRKVKNGALQDRVPPGKGK